MAMDRRRFEGGNLPLRTAMERLFEGSFISPQSVMGTGGFPPADVHMNDEDVTICLAVPGAQPEDINIQVTGEVVTISGQVQHRHRAERASQGQGQGGNRRPQPYLEEIWSGSFQRAFSLPTQVDANKASADFENGILTVTLPKSEANKPRKIQVQSRGTSTQGSGKQQQSQPQTETETVPVQSGS